MNLSSRYRWLLFFMGCLLTAFSPIYLFKGDRKGRNHHEAPPVGNPDRSRTSPGTPKQLNVAIFIHNGVEVLDFAGPSEVFASTEGFNVYTVSLTTEPIVSQGFVKVIPTYRLTDCPKPDILVLPGGDTGPFIKNKVLIDWIKSCSKQTDVLLSVCTGAGLLAKAGLLDGKQATTFHSYIELLQRATPKAKILQNIRFVDNGQIITTAGVSAGIDGALHVVAKLKGLAVAMQTARDIEYDKWKPNEGLVTEQSSNVVAKSE